MKFPVVMKTWAGADPYDFDYIKSSVASLLSSKMPDNAELLIYDDCSTDSRLKSLLQELSRSEKRVKVVFNAFNRGPNGGQEDVFSIVAREYSDAPYFINVDDDVIYHKDWMSRLMSAYDQFRQMGVTGVFTAINMPFRKAHSTLRTGKDKYYFKWKQPALNWLIPRSLYDDVGPFRDEGIAYDTAYSHWMRLKGYPVICMSPSYVQNIGLMGAYARGSLTTAEDFVGESEGYGKVKKIVNSLKYSIYRMPARLIELSNKTSKLVAPVRWGSEFVYEGENESGKACAMFPVDDAVKIGWHRNHVAERAGMIKKYQLRGPTEISEIRSNRKGEPEWIEGKWQFSPTLREYRRLGLGPWPLNPEGLLYSLIDHLLPLHANNAVHNKIRQDNIYIDPAKNTPFVSWFGVEPLPGINLQGDDETVIRLFGGAVDRWASHKIRERFAASFIEAYAPEVLLGASPTPASDIFSVGAVLSLMSDESNTLPGLRRRRQQWACGCYPENMGRYSAIIGKCLEADPARRFKNAHELKEAVSAQRG